MPATARSRTFTLGVSLFAALLPLAACAAAPDSTSKRNDNDTGSSGGFGNVQNGDGGPAVCANGATTSVSGVVYDPAGRNPLYNVVVYVPSAPLAALPTGATCDSCNSLYSGSPVATALTDASGKFTLKNVPAGANIPLVVQVGKWRKQVTLPSVAQCQDNPLADHALTLPKNGKEGDIPNIAISTGSSDSLECLLKRVGLDPSEYGGGASSAGHIHIFQGGESDDDDAPNTSPPGPRSATALWTSKTELAKYDIVLLSCEGSETTGMNQQALADYAAAGGRVFASHFHYSWFDTGPFGAANLASWTTGSQDIGDVSSSIVTTFPKGAALQQWLTNVNALPGGKLPIADARHNADVRPAHVASQAWINADGNAAGATEYFTFNTPLGAPAANQCGRVVYSDLHVGAASDDYPGDTTIVPTDCASGDLSPQEKALEFMLFDLSSCVTPDSQPPSAPPSAVN